MKSISPPVNLLGRVRTFDALRYHQSFRYLLSSSFLYSVGLWMQIIVMAWLAYELTGSAFLVAVYGAARMSPQIFGPFAGVLTDRVDRKRLIIILRILQACFASILAILSGAGLLQFWHLVAIGFLQGSVMTISYPVYSALSMDIVGRRDIANAMSLTMVVMNVTRVVGPVSGGALIAFLGPAVCFGIAAGLAVMAMVAILPLGLPDRIELTGPASVLQELAQGFRFIVYNRNMLAVWLITLVANLFVWPAYASFMPVFAKDNLGLDALGLGILASGFGIGALMGSLLIASLGDLKRKGLLYEVGTLLFALFFGFFVLSRWFPLAFSLVLLAGLASSAFGTMQSTLTLILAPEEMRGRSMGFLMLGIAGMSIGSLLLGVAASAIGASTATAISCSLLILSALAIIFWAPSLRRL